MTLQAARDLLAQGAQITSGGDLTAVGGRNLTVGAVGTTYQFDSGGTGNRLQVSQTTQHGSTVSAGGNATLVAQGGDLSVIASSVQADQDATLAGQNVTIASGVNSASRDLQAHWGGSSIHTTTATQSQAAASVSVGHDLTVHPSSTSLRPESGWKLCRNRTLGLFSARTL